MKIFLLFFLKGNNNCRVGTKTGSVGLMETRVFSYMPYVDCHSYHLLVLVYPYFKTVYFNNNKSEPRLTACSPVFL